MAADAQVSIWIDGHQPALGAPDRLTRLTDRASVGGARLVPPTTARRSPAGAARRGPELARLAADGLRDARLAYVALVLSDVRAAASCLRAAYERSGGDDGLVELACPPDAAADPAAVVALADTARRWTAAENLIIGVPATDAGLAALEELTYRGTNVAVDGVFCAGDQARAAAAYLGGLERRLAAGLPLDGIASVTWFPVALLDERIDATLNERSSLRGAVAVAAAHAAYLEAHRRFSGPRWQRLAARGARPQRVGFRDLARRDPARAPAAYAERLALPGCALACREDRLGADGAGRLAPCEPDETEVAWVLREAAAAGAPLATVGSALRRATRHRRTGVYHSVLAEISGRLAELKPDGRRATRDPSDRTAAV